jgi:hypothetical protein
MVALFGKLDVHEVLFVGRLVHGYFLRADPCYGKKGNETRKKVGTYIVPKFWWVSHALRREGKVQGLGQPAERKKGRRMLNWQIHVHSVCTSSANPCK